MRILPAFLLLLLGLSISAWPGDALADKVYHVDGVAIEAEALADGSLVVSEQRAYRFRGRFKYAYRTFSRQGGIDYADFAVSESGVRYTRDETGEPGTFQLREKDGDLEVRWFFSARNEERTFMISYVVKDLIRRHPDAAVLYYQFLGSGFARASANVSLRVQPPTALEAAAVRQWLHGPLWAESETRYDGLITAFCERLPAHRFLELRVLYPPEAFPAAPRLTEPIVPTVLEEERRWAEDANRRRVQAREKAERRAVGLQWGKRVAPWLGLAGFLVWLGIFWRYGRRPAVEPVPYRSSEIPAILQPALVNYLASNRSITGNSLMATLLDLASRGFLEFHEDSSVREYPLGFSKQENRHYWLLKRDYLAEHRAELLPFESQLLEFVFDELAGDDRADMDLFKQNRAKSRRFFQRWKQAVNQEARRRGDYAPQGFTGRNLGLALGGFLVLLAAPLGATFYEWALVPGGVGVLLMLLSLTMVHHTAEGAREAARWRSLRSYLTHDRTADAGFLDHLDRYLVYGVALGIGKRALTDLGDRIPEDRRHGYVPWYIMHGHDGAGAGSSFGAAFSASVSAVNSSMSSAAGAGGGASGGGGGGAGGGGGGAG